MERLARPKDDLFDNSTMTFGEHLDELRQALVKAILWLAGGMVIGQRNGYPERLAARLPRKHGMQPRTAH